MLNDYKFFKTRDGIELRTRAIERGFDKWLVATHGVCEHLERHDYLVDLFSHKYNILQYDLRGHGRSTGKRTYVNSFDDYAKDLDEIMSCMQQTFRMEKFVMFGHSMGALITAQYLQKYAKADLYPAGAFLTAPPIWVGGAIASAMSIVPTPILGSLSKMKVSIPLGGQIDMENLSHDPKVKQKYLLDELNSTKVHTRLAFNLFEASRSVFSRPLRAKCPVTIAVGSEDRIVRLDKIKDYCDQIDKSINLKIIDEGYHELHNEVERIKEGYFAYFVEMMDKCL